MVHGYVKNSWIVFSWGRRPMESSETPRTKGSKSVSEIIGLQDALIASCIDLIEFLCGAHHVIPLGGRDESTRLWKIPEHWRRCRHMVGQQSGWAQDQQTKDAWICMNFNEIFLRQTTGNGRSWSIHWWSRQKPPLPQAVWIMIDLQERGSNVLRASSLGWSCWWRRLRRWWSGRLSCKVSVRLRVARGPIVSCRLLLLCLMPNRPLGLGHTGRRRCLRRRLWDLRRQGTHRLHVCPGLNI